jgi:hypothetical protein
MRKTSLIAVLCVSLAFIAVGAALIVGRSDASGRTMGGPLACQGCGGGTGAMPVSVGERVSFGLVYLRNHGSAPAVLERVRVLNATPGLVVLGALAVELSEGGSVGVSREFPPRDPRGRVHRLRGYTINRTHGKEETSQVIVGLTVARNGEFSFHHIAVDYRVGKQRYRAIFHESLGLCAPRNTAKEQCPEPDI